MTKGRPKKENRVAETNIKVTKETHRAIQVAADMGGQATQSEIILLALKTLYPNLGEEIARRDALQKEAAERAERVRNK